MAEVVSLGTTEGLVAVLPPELQSHILSFLSPRFLCSCVCLVCSDWNELIQNESIWKSVCASVFYFLKPFGIEKPPGIRWKEWLKKLVTKAPGFSVERSAPFGLLFTGMGREQGKKREIDKIRHYRVECDGYENFRTSPFPPPHKLVLGSQPLVEGKRNYFEVRVESIASNSKSSTRCSLAAHDDNQIGVGIATQEVKVNEFLGQSAHGGGYYNTGCVGYGGTFSARWSPAPPQPFKAGDVVGVYVDLSLAERPLGFFVNGKFQGFPYLNLPKNKVFYPAVSLRHSGNRVLFNPMPVLPPVPNGET